MGINEVAKKNDLLYQMALMILPYALEFYGDRYKSTVISAFEHSRLYEWSEDVMNIISKEIGIHKTKLCASKNERGCYFSDHKDSMYKHIIILNGKMSIREKIFTITHELFSHAVFSEINPCIEINGINYNRNGVALVQNGDKKNKHYIEINEGIAEYITNEIIKLYDPKCSHKVFKKFNSEYYARARFFARLLFECLGKENMLDILVLNKGNINYLYNPDDLTEWDRLSEELKKVDPFLGIYVSDLKKRNTLNIEGKNVDEKVYIRRRNDINRCPNK